MPEPPPVTRSLRLGRFQIGLAVVVQTVLLIVLVGMINFINGRRYQEWDLSPNSQFTLSDKTRQVLGGLQDEVRLLIAFRRDSDVAGYVERMVEQYESLSEGRVQARFFDPELDANYAAEVSNRFDKLGFDQNMIIVDPADGKMRLVTEENIVERSTDNPLSRRIVRFKLEPELTGAIIAATRERTERVYLIIDKGALPKDSRGNDAAGVLATYGRDQNTEVSAMRIANQVSIPDDASGVALINPSVDLTPREIAILEDYWEGRQGALLVMLNPQYHGDTPQLNAFLRKLGVFPEDTRVMRNVMESTGTLKKQFTAAGYFLPDDPVTAKIGGVGTELPGQTMALRIMEDDPIFKSENIRLKPLLQATSGFWAESRYRQQTVKPDAQEDILEQVFLAASVEKGAAGDPRLNLDSSRMVVVGNASMLDPGSLLQPNLVFAMNAINWMTDREELIGIPPKEAGRFRINITEDKAELIKNITVWLLPGIVLVVGMGVSFLRRR